MKNKFIQLYLVSLAILIMGSLEITFNNTKINTSGGFNFSILNLLVGIIFLIFTIASHVKYNNNRKQLEKELSKEYDERDDLIEGKASYFTMSILMIVIFLMMFLSEWIIIPTNLALLIIIIFCIIINKLAKTYYNYFL